MRLVTDEPRPQPPSRFSHVTAGLAGGLITLAAVVVLALTGAFGGSGGAPNAQPTTVAAGPPVEDIYDRTRRSVAFVRATGGGPNRTPFGGGPTGAAESTGSGFLVDRDGHVVASAHVVEGAKAVTVQFSAGRPIAATVTGTDRATDLALLQIDPAAGRSRQLKLSDSQDLKVGDPVVAVGNPFGLTRTASAGIVSALARRIPGRGGVNVDNVIQLDFSISAADSGGPLLNRDGDVVGVTSLISPVAGGGPISFAIPADRAKQVIDRLRGAGSASR
jgi:S1-C subfamily serine protease